MISDDFNFLVPEKTDSAVSGPTKYMQNRSSIVNRSIVQQIID